MEFTMSQYVVNTGVVKDKYLHLRKSVDLDFIPQIGMSLALDGDGFEHDVERVIYDVKQKRFTIVFEDIRALSSNQFDRFVSKLKSSGWKELYKQL
ncbi:hypothetical protein MK805_01980 [Shimazuella sp. AN120528]|uniref:hypothetical protein n=1 Tax=Shimazuella soli TaxID=1892854 RepID=UPI001F0CFBA9|nr:hypothetical protein [Shimazuella soli]MCH5583737.1 hypothetical protein [Shimazuella soli]